MYIIVATTGGLIDHVEVGQKKAEAIEVADKLAANKEYPADDVRIFELKRGNYVAPGIAGEIYSAPMPGQD